MSSEILEPLEPEPVPEPEPKPVGRHVLALVRRVLRVVLFVLVAIVVGLVMALVVIDLGPSLKPLAEREASRLIQRPLHIGRLSANLVRGRFVFDDLVIDNIDPKTPPFFHAGRIAVTLPWWTILLRHEIFVESVIISDWQMRVETFAGGGHNFIKLPQRQQNAGPRRYTTTVQLVRAERGEFTYQDRGAPWSTVARNLDFTLAKLRDYRGEARFTGGTVQIQRYEPMWANMYCTFKIDGGLVLLDRIDLETDGATSSVTGTVNLARWPEQTYEVQSRVHFPRMREIFFAGNAFSLSGDGHFNGTFKLFKGGRDLSGRFESQEAGLNAWRFPRLNGRLRWTPDRFEVTDAESDFYGGRLKLAYSMAPLGAAQRAQGKLETQYQDVSLPQISDFMAWPGLRLAGHVTGSNLMEWPIGRFRERRGRGELRAVPPPEVVPMTPVLPDAAEEAPAERGEMGPFNPNPLLDYLSAGAALTYRYDGEWVDVDQGQFATAKTFVSFDGRTAYGQRSVLPFHVTSADWQESDRVLAAIIGAFGAPAHAVPIGGSGEFEGVMNGAFTSPRITGRFRGRHMRAWDVDWGAIDGDVMIFNSYVDLRNGHVRSGGRSMDLEGRFSIGYPRRDNDEEFDTRVQVRGWPTADFKHAFGLDDYSIAGVLSGEFHVYDHYQAPQGFGSITMADMIAYGERFETASAGLRFEGNGVRLDTINARKGVGSVTGAAFVGWNGTYSFNADGHDIAIDDVEVLRYPQAPLSGQIHFSASGSGSFDAPRYEVRGRIDDLFLRDEGIGQVTGRLIVRDDVVTIDQLEIASSRLAISGSGRVALTPEADGELVFRFQDTSLDPYVRVLRPQLSPFTTAVASGSLRVFGELRNMESIRSEAVIDRVDLTLFDYRLRNDGDIRLSLADQRLQVDRLKLIGEGTSLEVAGDVRFREDQVALQALGDANLGILQGLLRDIRSSGNAELQAQVRGPLEAPTMLGALNITDGRFRHFAFPHSFENVNGRVDFDAAGLNADLHGHLGGGDIRINGRLGFRGLSPTDYNITAVGQGMRLRYPEGFRSLVDADLALRGEFFTPVLTGLVTVRNATLERTFDTSGTGLFGFAAAGVNVGARPAEPAQASRIPVRFDVRLVAPSTLRVENRAARLVSSAELTLRGTYDQPLVFGRVEIERGEVLFEGNRYQVTRGIVDFLNPNRIEPLFDIEAETQARVPGQTYRVVTRVAGTPDHFTFDLTSDPPLATVDILSLLFGDVRDPQNAELRALRSPDQAQQELLRARAARLLASPISANVGRVVEEAIGVDTVQITPMLNDLSAQESSRLTPSARVTVGKRISDRIYLTYSRALNASTLDEIILLEIDQSDRFSWVLSQNEDRTYAIDVRVRRVF